MSIFKKMSLLGAFLIAGTLISAQENSLLSPNEFLPHRVGEEFTPHHQLMAYFTHVAANSNLVKLQPYGVTYQDRPLMIAIVTSQKNQGRLEEIRLNNLRLAGLEEGEADTKEAVAIVWLSFSVHGNEPSGSESSMQILYDLVNPSNSRTKEWLENTVVILDPSLNPDGYDRYTHWFRNVANRIPNPNLESREHSEPWPGGRVNHYLFDLNRDWAWLTQQESRQRVKIYQEWLPHVHPDFHEQYINSPYYFAPAAEPFHQYITPWQREFQTEIGKNHVGYFDKNGWLYYTREVFDLFYPAYGDTYPLFNGAIGMTYEQAGHSMGGVAAMMASGDTLTLEERVQHHITTGLSTIEVCSENAVKLVENFRNYYQNAQNNPAGDYKTFIIRNKPEDAARLRALTELLSLHKIQYGSAGKSIKNASVLRYSDGAEGQVDINSGDLIISAYQPKSVLAQVLLEPESFLVDSVTYDVTAWALPFAYGLEAYASTQRISSAEEFTIKDPAISQANSRFDEPYAFLAPWNSVNSASFLGELFKNNIKARFSSDAFHLEGRRFEPGTIIISLADNRGFADWNKKLREIAREKMQELHAVQTGFSSHGSDLGSDRMLYIKPPEVAVLYGEGVDNGSYGFIWYYLEQDLNYPFAALEAEKLKSFNLSDYSTIILPEGNYLNEELIQKLEEWASQGGKLIAIGNACKALENNPSFSLKGADKEKAESDPKTSFTPPAPYAQTERDMVTESTPGAVVKVRLDKSHPLAFGLGDYYFSLKTNSFYYPLLSKGWNVGITEENIQKYGFIGTGLLQKLPNTLVFGVENIGKGKVVYFLDDPLFRGFWYNGKLLFSNALFLN